MLAALGVLSVLMARLAKIVVSGQARAAPCVAKQQAMQDRRESRNVDSGE